MQSALAAVTTTHHRPRADYPTVVVGLGVSGLSCARFLRRLGIRFAVTDSRPAPPGYDRLARECPDLEIAVDGLDADLIGAAKQVVVSPGVSLQEPVLQQALRSGVEVIGDIELFARHAGAPVVAITGSNGKSTVTTLFAAMALAAGKDVRCGGNLGTPALDLLSEHEPDLYVLELSSFQLETTESLNPAAATVLNISPDHLDRYSSLEDYSRAKQRLFRGDGAMVINMDDPKVKAMAIPGRATQRFGLRATGPTVEFGITERAGQTWLTHAQTPLLPTTELRIRGHHNVANALAALALGSAIDLDMDAMLTALRDFSGLPHRCQWVTEAQGVEWYNDSKGTNEGATCAAIEGLATGSERLILIAGGQAKGADFSALAKTAKGRLKVLIALGEDASLLIDALTDVVPVVAVSDMQEAVVGAMRLAQPGDTVLLSPACASFDMYTDYRQRGEVFMSAVLEQVLAQ